jgi:hypothetical protein
MPSQCKDFGFLTWMFKLEQTENDFPFAAKLRDIFRSDFERFIVYYYGDIKRYDDEQFNCCHLRTMLREFEETKDDAVQKHILRYPKPDWDMFKGVDDAYTIMKIAFAEQAKTRANVYLDKLAEFWFFMDGQDEETVLRIINRDCYPKMPELVDQEFMQWFSSIVQDFE